MKKYLLVCFLVFMARTVFADTITLVSGKQFEGKVIEQNEQFVKFDAGVGLVVTFYKDEIASVKTSVDAPAQVKREPSLQNKDALATADIDTEWGVFEQFLGALKGHDVQKATALSYNPLPCSPEECGPIFDMIYSVYRDYKKTDFIDAVKDSKQCIISTREVLSDGDEERSYTKNSIVFIVNPQGAWVLLTAEPRVWGHTKKATNLPTEEIEKALRIMMQDSDADGKTDNEETCQGAQEYNSSCVKTDASLKDTDGDGWWDGVEKLAKTDPNDLQSHL
ncbi:MAG: hypothetical protein HQL20_09055 [Candidatus Omnitrophica bacterium]|nr:hypothetical protein [Candidatus Omnitrophota bacterium]